MAAIPSRRALGLILAASVGLLVPVLLPAAPDEKPPDRSETLRAAVGELVKMQEKEGEWPYEGVYRVGGQIPIGYRVGGTAIVADTLLYAAPDDKAARAAIEKALAFVLKQFDAPGMAASTRDGYDVRVWGHSYALEFLCHVRAAKAAGEHAKAVETWIPKLVETLVTEEVPGGGWNYASRRQQASFVTAPVAQSLLLARSQGEKVPDEVLDRARKVLENSRTEEAAFVYSGNNKRTSASDKPAGSAARSAVCETTLVLLGGGSTDAIRGAVAAFHKHWDELEKRRQKTGTHEGPYRIAPYYFYYGHRYAAQAIEMLPEKERAAERERLLKVLFRTRDKDGTWNDRVFPRSKNYGTAMAALVLLADKVPVPPKYTRK